MPTTDTPSAVSGIPAPTNVSDTSVPSSPQIAGVATSPTTSPYVPYERFSEVNRQKAELQAELEQYKSQQTRVQEETGAPQDEATRAYYKKALKFADVDDVSQVKLELETLKRQQFDNYLMMEAQKLEGKYNGDGGKPKFNLQEVLAYSAEKNIPNLEAAYMAQAFEKMQTTQATQPTFVESSSQATTSLEPTNTLTDADWAKLSKQEREKWLDDMSKAFPHAD